MLHNPYYKDGKLYRVHKNKVVNEVKAITKPNGVPYIQFRKDYKCYMAHRYIWEIFNGKISKGMVIDHKNGNSLDNRIENLRCVSISENLLNSNNRIRSDNTSGIRGVSWSSRDKKWVVTVSINKKSIYLGCSKDLDQAKKI